MGGIDIAVQIHLDGRVERDHTQTPDDFRMVRDLVGANDDSAAEVLYMIIKPLPTVLAQCHRTGGDKIEHSRLQQTKCRVLHDLGVHTQPTEPAGGQAGQHGVPDRTNTGLDWPWILGKSPFCNLLLNKLDNILPDFPGGGGNCLKLLRGLLLSGQDDCSNLLRRARHIWGIQSGRWLC